MGLPGNRPSNFKRIPVVSTLCPMCAVPLQAYISDYHSVHCTSVKGNLQGKVKVCPVIREIESSCCFAEVNKDFTRCAEISLLTKSLPPWYYKYVQHLSEITVQRFAAETISVYFHTLPALELQVRVGGGGVD